MAATDATVFPVKGQAFRISFGIRSSSTGNLLTGGLTGLSATISKDGGAAVATTNAPVETGTTGTGDLDLTATEMNCTSCKVVIHATNANEIDDGPVTIRTLNLTEIAGAWHTQSPILLEQLLMQMAGYLLEKVTMGDSTSVITLFKRDTSTSWLTGSASDDGTTTTKPPLR